MAIQISLAPDHPVTPGLGPWRPPGAIPRALRSFGKFVDTSDWLPGDLILTRPVGVDHVSSAILKAQSIGGYADEDAHWIHAAMYLGDGLTLCEATFSLNPFEKRGVVLTNIWDYCGEHVIRLRRPNRMANDNDRWLLAISALTHLKKDYDFAYVLGLAWRALLGKGFWTQDTRSSIRPSALVCSTLYADAYTSRTRQVLGERGNGHCTPAYLSQCSDFVDHHLRWVPL